MSEIFQYKLVTDIRIQKETWQGQVKNGQPVEGQGYYSSNGAYDALTVREETTLGSMDFIGVMGVLGRLHESLQNIKEINEK